MFGPNWDWRWLFSCLHFEIISDLWFKRVYETIGIATEALLDPPPVPEPIFLKLMHIATKRLQFSFNNAMYQQTNGTSKGNPLRAALTNIFGQTKLFKIINLPLFNKRYADDTFVIFFSKSESRRFFNNVNQQHRRWYLPVNSSKTSAYLFRRLNWPHQFWFADIDL